MTQILDGKKLREKLLAGLKQKIDGFQTKPTLVVILVGENPASKIYVNNKKKTAEELGINSQVINYPADISEKELLTKIEELNNDSEVTAILVQLPLPKHINKDKVAESISPKKDIDCFNPENVGRLVQGLEPYFYPVTPQGVMMLIDEYGIEVAGKHAVIIGRSNIVGKPMAQMLLARDATVTICHSKTENLEDIIKTADILISAVGKKIVRCKMVKCESVVIDVGISRDSNGKISGDVEFSDLVDRVKYITPVPGGVGPMTIASLMYNLLRVK